MPLLLVMLLVLPLNALALTIHQMTAPLWVERDGQHIAATIGQDVHVGDVIEVAENGYLALDMRDGSLLTLAGGSRLMVEAGEGDLPVLHLTRGVVRLTAEVVPPSVEVPLNHQLQLGTIRVQATEADMIGRSDDSQDVLCLLDGRVSANSPNQPEFTLHLARQILSVGKGHDAFVRVYLLDEDSLSLWLQQLQPIAGQGLFQREGYWSLMLLSVQTPSYAVKLQKRLVESGYVADLEKITYEDMDWFRVLMNQLASLEEAQALGEKLTKEFELDGYWVSRNRQ